MYAKAKTEWVWTKLTESLRGIGYPAHEIRKSGQPVPGCFRKTVHRSWVEKGYVVDASEMGQLEFHLGKEV